MPTTESTSEEESILEYMIHFHLSERRFEIEALEEGLSRDRGSGSLSGARPRTGFSGSRNPRSAPAT